mmetsp:Transcript_24341/g.62464  ORF Transcript_24341/g.62464 Transcript_24341/m.62464 type:complete len:208 (+) Transcript_24341:942-1565(+)
MPPEDGQAVHDAAAQNGPRNEETELPITNNSDFVARLDVILLHNPASSCKRLHKYRLLQGDGQWHLNEICHRHDGVVCKASVLADDAKDCAVGTVVSRHVVLATTHSASLARKVYFPAYRLSDPLRRGRAALHSPHKLVAHDRVETWNVAFCYLQVSGAHSSTQDAYQSLVRSWDWNTLLHNGNAVRGVESHCTHHHSSLSVADNPF